MTKNHESHVKMAKNPYILCKNGQKSSIIIDYRLRIQENHGEMAKKPYKLCKNGQKSMKIM
jgi:hypothetical protein